MSSTERRTTYVQIKDDVKTGAAATVILGRKEPLTCRVAINAGLELVIAGLEFLKVHGVTKDKVMAFVEQVMDRPGDIDDMRKGGRDEGLLRAAMKMVNGEIVRHSVLGAVIEGEAKDDHDHDVAAVRPHRVLDPTLN